MHRVLFVSILLVLWVGTPARSQFTQYTVVGAAASAPEEAAQKARQEAEAALWRLGPFRIQPHLELSDVGYYENVFSAPEGETKVNDSRATLGAGLASYVFMGSNSLLSAFVIPEYSAWQDNEDLSEFGVNSGLAWFGSFSRLTLSAGARNTEQQQPLSTETNVPVQISEDGLAFEAALEMTRRLAIFGAASDSKVRHAKDVEQFLPGLDLRSLDRDENRNVIGLELRGSDLRLRVGYEATEVDFVDGGQRSNTGKGPSVRLDYDRNKLLVSFNYEDLEIEFADPGLGKTNQASSHAVVAFRLRPDTTARVYASESLAFTTVSTTGIIETENLGLGIEQHLSRRMVADVFAETGEQAFVDRENPGRVDDLEAYGVTLRFQVTERLTVSGHYRDETTSSTLSGFDRSTSSLGFAVELRGDLLPW